MTTVERTRQQLDPAGSVGVRLLVALLATASFALAITMTLIAASEIDQPVLAGLSLSCLGAAILTLIISTRPARRAYSNRAFVVLCILGLGAIALSAASTWGTNTMVRDDWGATAFGVLLIAAGPYRPTREIMAAGIITATLVGFLVLMQAPGFSSPAPHVAFVLVAVTPLLAMCFGSVAYSKYVVEAIEIWQRRARRAVDTELAGTREVIARSVGQDRVTILSRDVLPFFSSLLTTNRISEADADEARRIADSIRAVMVTEADRSWIDSVAGALSAGSFTRVKVTDRARLADELSPARRTAVRALLAQLVELVEPSLNEADSAVEPITLIRIGRVGKRGCHITVSVPTDSYDYLRRLALAPYLAVIRAEFDQVESEFSDALLKVRFSYEQR